MITMMFWYGTGWAWWQAGLMWIGMMAFWGLLIWAVHALVTYLTRKPRPEPPGDDARTFSTSGSCGAGSAPTNTRGCAA